jgi:hypothetical protein
LREDRPLQELQFAVPIRTCPAKDVHGEEIIRALDPAKGKCKNGCESLGKSGFSKARSILDQKRTARKKGRKGKLHLAGLSKKDRIQGLKGAEFRTIHLSKVGSKGCLSQVNYLK